MTDLADGKRDFFVSFNKADRSWATWIAWVLEEAGYSVFFQDWDFRGSLIEQMDQASRRAERTLVVLSDHYLRSEYARPEAWVALASDSVGREGRLVIVKVGPTTRNLGLLSHLAYLDLTTSVETDAERLLLEWARRVAESNYRAKPPARPAFPGGAKRKVPEKPSFPEAATPKPTRVFIRYSNADRKWLDRLERHLKPLVREGRLDYWDDTHIRPGDDWKQEIQNALDTAQVAVLLISANFFASDFIAEDELPLLLAAQAKGVRILPVILSASRFTRYPDLARFQAVNSPDKPLDALPRSQQEEVFDRIAQVIESSFSLEYYVQTRGGPRNLNEANLILVGFGGVGKTSLVNRLTNDRFDPNERKTEGIAITDWPIRIHNQQVLLHVWDFGGQEIMHAMHQFFLTQQSLYVLVLTGRQGREDADAEYWLNQIASFAADSPVIIVLNKIKEHTFEITRRALCQKFPNICDIVATDCADRTGLDALNVLIRREIDALPHLHDKFPVAWFTIKDLLSEMTENYLTFDRYRTLCAENGEADAEAQEKLASFLHNLGIALNYKDDLRLRDTHVLNPRWVTEGVYTILNHSKLAEQKGELSAGDLAAILDPKQYPLERHGFLLELMRKFELCFPFPEEEDHYLVPELLGKEQPAEVDSFDPAACLNFEYYYQTMLPKGLLPRFIVRSYILSADAPRWRSGVILNLEGNRALVVGDPDSIGQRVRIAIAGPAGGRRRLLAVIRSDFERIHSGYKFQPQEMIPIPGHPNVIVSYAKLLVFERSGVLSFQEVADDQVLTLAVRDLLDGVDLDGIRLSAAAAARADQLVRAFISYSHKDESLRAELETHLKLLNRKGLLDLWTDRRITAGAEWKEEIDENLEGANLVLLLVSADFIASDYCYGKEMHRALERHAAGDARVIPIIVRDVNWRSAPFAKLHVLPKDGKAVAAKGRPRLARDAAWKNVAEGIERILIPTLINQNP
jgi:internalin A